MEAKSQLSPPCIRSAMSMSRRAVTTPKSPNSSLFQSFSSLFPLSQTSSGNHVLQPLQPVRSARHCHRSSYHEVITHSPYQSHEKERKAQWGQYKETHADKLYENWETDECLLEDKNEFNRSLGSGISTSKSDCSFKVGPKIRLFRPCPIKVGQRHTITHISHATATTPKSRSNSIPNKLWKHSKSALFPPLSAASSSPMSHHKAKHSEIVLQPTLRLTVIDSEELDESPAQIVPEKKRDKRSEKPVPKPAESHIRRVSVPDASSNNTRYCEDTAAVLGDTSSLARRRSMQMVVPARLLRHAFTHK